MSLALAGELHQFVDVALVGEPGFRILAVVGVGVEGDLGECADDFRVLLGEVFAHDPRIEGRRAKLGQFAGVISTLPFSLATPRAGSQT
jgi:hypothetical protein